MPDIQMRFGRDMLVMAAPVDAALRNSGVDVDADREFMNLVEPEAIRDAMRLDMLAGAHCLVSATDGITRARLSHGRLEDRAAEIASAATTVLTSLKPQHLIALIGATGLPIDPDSKTSLVANRDQYRDAVACFDDAAIDMFLLDRLAGTDDVRCALMGARMVTDTPVAVSVDVDTQGAAAGCAIEDIVAVAVDCEASVMGIRTRAMPTAAADIVARIRSACDLPVLVQFDVEAVAAHGADPTPEHPYPCADVMMDAAGVLRAAGAQMLRAVGSATPAYTGALAAAVSGLDVV